MLNLKVWSWTKTWRSPWTCHLRLLCYQSPNDGGNLPCCYFVI